MSVLSEKINAVAVNYLGPAAGVFMERQTRFHLNGLKFEDVEKQHLTDLAKWVQVSAALVIDKQKAKELSDKIAVMTYTLFT